MTNPTSNFGWQMPTSTDLVTDLPADFEVFGQAVDTSLADLKGGTTGQVLAKASNTNMDFVWTTDATGIPASAFTAKGNILVGTGSGTFVAQAVGANGTILTANSAQADGVEWVAPAGGGKVLQVINASQGTQVATSSASFITTGLTATITPTKSTSKILVLVSQNGVAKSTGSVNNRVTLQLHRNGVDILQFAGDLMTTSTSLEQNGSASTCFLDNPATTSAVTYDTKFCSPAATATSYVQYFSSTFSTITLLEIGA
jgi:hypothetical protein